MQEYSTMHAFHFFQQICILQEYLNCCRNISYTFFRISCTCRKHVSGTFEKCGPFFYLGVAQLEKLLNENMLETPTLFLICAQRYLTVTLYGMSISVHNHRLCMFSSSVFYACNQSRLCIVFFFL